MLKLFQCFTNEHLPKLVSHSIKHPVGRAETLNQTNARKTHQYKSFPPGSITWTACPSACRALMCCLSVSPTRCARRSRDDCGSAARARLAGEGCGGGGRREEEEGECGRRCSGTSLDISRLSSAWPSSSSCIFLRSSSAAAIAAGKEVTAGSNGTRLPHQLLPPRRPKTAPLAGMSVASLCNSGSTAQKGTFYRFVENLQRCRIVFSPVPDNLEEKSGLIPFPK